MRIYVAGSSADLPSVESVMARLRAAGHRVYDWTEPVKLHGHVTNEFDRRRFAARDLIEVANADAVLMLAPGSPGSWTEYGYALACDRRVLIAGGQTNIFGVYAEEYENDDLALRALNVR